MRAIICLALAASLSACAVTRWGNTDEGGNDYRVFVPPSKPGEAPAECIKRLGKAATDKWDADASRVAYNLGCYSRFQHQPPAADVAADKTFFQPKEKIAIYLKTIAFHYFTESDFEMLSNDVVDGIFGNSKVKGEIAILANVTQNARNPGSLGPDGQLQGKVVYFGNDIYRGQLADEYNIPIYGAEEWSGGPLTIDLWVIELDQAQSQQLGSILKTLSGLATKFTGLTAGGGEVLNQVGTAFLNSNRDDVIGHIAFTLVPPTPGEKTADPLLRVSDIIVHRTETADRNLGVPFDNCYYEPLQAKVYCKKSGSPRWVPERNAMVLAVRRATTASAMVSDIGLADLNDRLSKATTSREVTQIIQASSDNASAKVNVQSAMASITRMASPATSTAVRSFDAEQVITLLQCALVAQRKGPSAADTSAVATAELTFDKYCGPRSMRGAIGMDDFNLLARKIVELLQIDTGDLSFATMVGDDPYANLAALRTGLVSKFVPR